MGETVRMVHDSVDNLLASVLVSGTPASDHQILQAGKIRVSQNLLHHGDRSLAVVIVIIIVGIGFGMGIVNVYVAHKNTSCVIRVRLDSGGRNSRRHWDFVLILS